MGPPRDEIGAASLIRAEAASLIRAEAAD